METVITNEEKDTSVLSKLQDIQVAISWREIANTYFGRSASWLYKKLDGKDDGFTAEEKEKLRGALFDIARRIRVSAEAI